MRSGTSGLLTRSNAPLSISRATLRAQGERQVWMLASARVARLGAYVGHSQNGGPNKPLGRVPLDSSIQQQRGSRVTFGGR